MTIELQRHDYIARLASYQLAAKHIYQPLLDSSTSISFLETANDNNSVLAHNARVEYARIQLLYRISHSLNIPMTGPLDPAIGNMSLHDEGKSFLHPNPDKAAMLLDPEEHGLAVAQPKGSQMDNRSLELRVAYLLHPDLGYSAIMLLSQMGIIPENYAKSTLPGAYGHHESIDQRSYPRLVCRDINITSATIGRLADMAVGLGVESRKYRNGVVNRETQRKIFNAIMSDNLLKQIVAELKLPDSPSEIIWLREIFIDHLFAIEDQMGVVNPDERLSFFDIPSEDDRYGLSDHRKIGQLIWRKDKVRLGDRRLMLQDRLERGLLIDLIREDIQ